MKGSNKILMILLLVAVIVLIGVLGYLLFIGLPKPNYQQPGNTTENIPVNKISSSSQDKTASDNTKDIIEQAKDIQTSSGDDGIIKTVNINRVKDDGSVETSTEEAIIIAEGTSPISLDTGEVLTMQGVVADNSSEAGSQVAPQQSFPVEGGQLPKGTVKLVVDSHSITPSSFTVKAGQLVSLAVTAGGGDMANFRFSSPLLKGVYVGLGFNETRVVNFTAPAEKGEYEYYSDFKDFRNNGAVGKMIVE